LKNRIFVFILTLFSATLITSINKLSAEEEQESSHVTDLILRAGIGTGSSLFGVVNNSTNQSKIGDGKGTGFDAGVMANYSFLFVAINTIYTTYNDMSWKEDSSPPERKFKSYGNGYFWTFDTIAGLKFNTKPGDMGHTDLYTGIKYWEAKRDFNSIAIDGVVQADSSGKYKISGYGWIFGLQDFSTIPVNSISAVIDTGFWLYNAPVQSFEKDGKNVKIKNEKSNGFGFKLGLGIAKEDIGLSLTGGIKAELTGATFKYKNGTGEKNLIGAGYMQFFLTVTKQISL